MPAWVYISKLVNIHIYGVQLFSESSFKDRKSEQNFDLIKFYIHIHGHLIVQTHQAENVLTLARHAVVVYTVKIALCGPMFVHAMIDIEA